MNNRQSIKNAIKRKFPAIDINDTLETAIKVMAQDNVSAVVVKVGEELVGVVTITDIMYSLANEANLQETRVSSFMTKCEFISQKPTRNPCIQLDEDEEVLSAIKVMYEAGINHLLVSGSKGEPVGMVSSLEMMFFL